MNESTKALILKAFDFCVAEKSGRAGFTAAMRSAGMPAGCVAAATWIEAREPEKPSVVRPVLAAWCDEEIAAAAEREAAERAAKEAAERAEREAAERATKEAAERAAVENARAAMRDAFNAAVADKSGKAGFLKRLATIVQTGDTASARAAAALLAWYPAQPSMKPDAFRVALDAWMAANVIASAPPVEAEPTSAPAPVAPPVEAEPTPAPAPVAPPVETEPTPAPAPVAPPVEAAPLPAELAEAAAQLRSPTANCRWLVLSFFRWGDSETLEGVTITTADGVVVNAGEMTDRYHLLNGRQPAPKGKKNGPRIKVPGPDGKPRNLATMSDVQSLDAQLRTKIRDKYAVRTRAGLYAIDIRAMPEVHELIKAHEAERAALVAQSVIDLPLLIEADRIRLEGIFKIGLYPSAEAYRQSFGMEWTWERLDSAGQEDLTADMVAEQRAQMEVQAQRERAELQAQMRAMFVKLADGLRERLTDNPDGSKKRLTDSKLDALREYVRLFELRNANDPSLANQVKRVASLLDTGVDMDVFKSDAALRARTAAALGEVSQAVAKLETSNLAARKLRRKVRGTGEGEGPASAPPAAAE